MTRSGARLWYPIIALLANADLPALANGNDALGQILEPVPYGSHRPIPFRLAKVERLNRRPGINISYQTSVKIKMLGKPKPALDIEFASMTRREFELVQRAYRGSTARWVEGKRYRLTDFLPAAIQATEGRCFRRRMKDQGNEMDVSSNCWGTAYEIARNDPHCLVLFNENNKIHQFVFDPLFSSSICDFEAAAGTAPEVFRRKLQRCKTGDVLFVYQDIAYRNTGRRISHAATFIDEGLFYEKTGSASKAAYRLVDDQTLFEHWTTFDYSYCVRRFNRQHLQHPATFFGLKANEMMELKLR